MSSAAPELSADVDSTGWSAATYRRTASFVYSDAFTSPVLDLLAAKPGERILDLGCGSGELTMRVSEIVTRQETPGGYVVGVDASESMVDATLSKGLAHAYVSDAQVLDGPAVSPPHTPYDAVISNATLHWCKRDPKGVLHGVRKALKKHGRFACEMGGHMNMIGVRAALSNVLTRRGYDATAFDPWYFPSVDEYSELLISTGFTIDNISLVPRITPLPAGLLAWLDLFVRPRFATAAVRNKNDVGHMFTEDEITDIFKEVERICAIDCRDSKGNWSVMYIRLRFLAIAV